LNSKAVLTSGAVPIFVKSDAAQDEPKTPRLETSGGS